MEAKCSSREEEKGEVKASASSSKDEEEASASSKASYWSGTPGLLRRATAHCYRMIIAPASEGGLKEFLDDESHIFRGWSRGDEHTVEQWDLYKRFESRVNEALENFVAAEVAGASDRRQTLDELHDAIRRGIDDPDDKRTNGVDAAVSMLLAAADFHKFCSIMRQRANKQQAPRKSKKSQSTPSEAKEKNSPPGSS